ncbi:hypothetical protein AB0M54_24425 [Actinoplanes sp. NPDC051470]|uniref:hypothetical protein n=1 Tax=Actinoplanes sp. NPDC051470 TaxID=3157224 RepID=UPI0034383F03
MTMWNPGDTVTVAPHKLPVGMRCGRWTGVLLYRCRGAETQWCVQEIGLVDGQWRRRMATNVDERHLTPWPVQLDLFGMPVGAS